MLQSWLGPLYFAQNVPSSSSFIRKGPLQFVLSFKNLLYFVVNTQISFFAVSPYDA
jgi:hypothetical protein